MCSGVDVAMFKSKYSKSSPFAWATFLNYPAHGKTTMREVKTLWEKWDQGTKNTNHDAQDE